MSLSFPPPDSSLPQVNRLEMAVGEHRATIEAQQGADGRSRWSVLVSSAITTGSLDPVLFPNDPLPPDTTLDAQGWWDGLDDETKVLVASTMRTASVALGQSKAMLEGLYSAEMTVRYAWRDAYAAALAHGGGAVTPANPSGMVGEVRTLSESAPADSVAAAVVTLADGTVVAAGAPVDRVLTASGVDYADRERKA